MNRCVIHIKWSLLVLFSEIDLYWDFNMLILELVSFLHADTLSPDFTACSPIEYITSWISLCTTLGVKNLQLTEGSECFKLYFDLYADMQYFWRGDSQTAIKRKIDENKKYIAAHKRISVQKKKSEKKNIKFLIAYDK